MKCPTNPGKCHLSTLIHALGLAGSTHSEYAFELTKFHILGVIEQPCEPRLFPFRAAASVVALGVAEQPGERRLIFYRAAESVVALGLVE